MLEEYDFESREESDEYIVETYKLAPMSFREYIRFCNPKQTVISARIEYEFLRDQEII